jgi:hypothetical protein
MSNQPDFRIDKTSANQADYAQLFYEIEQLFWGPTGTDADKAYVAQGSPGQRVLFVMTLFARLVDNGGLMSFYESSPFYSSDVMEAVTLLEFSDMKKVFAESLELLCKGEAAPEDSESGRRMLQALTEEEIERLDEITGRLYDGSGVEDRLFPYFKKYVDTHPEDFFKNSDQCLKCNGKGTRSIGARWRDDDGVERSEKGSVVDLVSRHGLDDPLNWLTDTKKWDYLYAACESCNGTGKLSSRSSN